MATSQPAPSIPSEPIQAEPHALPGTQWLEQIQSWQVALWLLITWRLALETITVLAMRFLPITVTGGDWLNLVVVTTNPLLQAVVGWQRWDALWYQQIAEHGYHAGDGTTHFQPLFPLLMRVVSLPLFGHTVLAGLIVSSIAFYVAMDLLFRTTRSLCGPLVAIITVLIVAFSPVGFFLLAPYTEGVYLVLVLGSLYYARRGQFWIAGLLGAAAALTRIPGVFMVVPLVFECLRQRRERNEWPDIDLIAALLPGAAMVGLTLYERYIVGEHIPALTMAARWGFRFVTPWGTVADSLGYIGRTGNPVEILNFFMMALCIVLTIVAVRTLPLIYSMYVIPNLLLLACSENLLSPYESVARYTLVLFPCWIVLARWFATKLWIGASWIFLGVALQIILFVFWLHFGFVA